MGCSHTLLNGSWPHFVPQSSFDFEWDENKRLTNIEKHGIDFEDAIGIWEGDVVEVPSRGRHGENRLVAFGVLEGRTIAVVYSDRGGARRIISARRASRSERENYEAAVG